MKNLALPLLLASALLAPGQTGETSFAIEADKLVSSDAGTTNAEMGTAVAETGGTLLLGGARWNLFQGNLYVYEPSTQSPGDFLEIKSVRSALASGGARFGAALAVDGDVLAVGAPSDQVDVPPNRQVSDGGSVFIFERNTRAPNDWGETAEIFASDLMLDQFFGSAVDLDGDTLVVGGSRNDAFGTAYVFQRSSNGRWREIKKLVPDTTRSLVRYGSAVAVCGDIIAVGAPQNDSPNQPPGSVFLFQRNRGGPNNWAHIKTITAPLGPNDNRFGATLDMDGDTLAVTALRANTNLNPPGAIFLFERNEGGRENWGFRKRITSGSGPADFFGISLDLEGDVLVAGASAIKRAFVFDRNGGGADNWGQSVVLSASDEDTFVAEKFGQAVAIGDRRILVGSADRTAGLNDIGGAVYVYSHTRDVPVIGRQPRDTVRLLGQGQQFESHAVGPGPLRHQWYFNGEALPGERGPTLQLTNLQREDAGFYWVRVSNSFGVTESNRASLTVLPRLNGIAAQKMGTGQQNNTSGDLFTVGYRFTPRADMQVTHLGIFDANSDGTVRPVEVGLWETTTRRLLARIELTYPDTSALLSDFYRYLPVAPVTLLSGREYRVAWYTRHEVPIGTNTNSLQTASQITVGGTVRTRGSSMAYPDENVASSNSALVQPSFIFSLGALSEIEVRDGSSAGDPLVPRGQGEMAEFAPAVIGPEGVERTFLIENKGGSTLSLSHLSLPEGFSLVGELPASIAPQGNAPLTIRLSSPTPGRFTGRIRFGTNVADENPYSFTAAGTVILPEVRLTAADPASTLEDGDQVISAVVARTGPTNLPLTVALVLTGSAELGTDFDLLSTTPSQITIPVGSPEITISISPREDNLEEPDEEVIITLQDGVGYTLHAEDTAVTATILNDDYAPVANHDPVYTIVEDGSRFFDTDDSVLQNDTDQDDGDGPANLLALLVEDVLHGTLDLTGKGSFRYTPDPDYFGPDSFTYQASDGTNESAPVTVMIEVTELVDLVVMASQDVEVVGAPGRSVHTLVLRNDGPSNADGILLDLNQLFPGGVTRDSLAVDLGTVSSDQWSIPHLAENETATLEISYQVTVDARGEVDAISTSATVVSLAQPLTNPDDDSSSVSSSIISPGDIAVLEVTAAPGLNRQNGLFTQQVSLTNNNPLALAGFCLEIGNLPPGVTAYNALASATGGLPFVESNQDLAPGESLTLTFEFFRADLDPAIDPTYNVTALHAHDLPAPAAAASGTEIDRFLVLENGDILIEFTTTPGSSYAIEYSHDMITWHRVAPNISANANRTLWIDSGPPKTSSPPSAETLRFYRTVTLAE